MTDFERKLEASSLGTPDAVAMRQRTTPEQAARVIARSKGGPCCDRVIARSKGGPCCDSHNEHCEPPSELCCWRCWEAAHVGLFPHADGTPCVLDEGE